MRVGSLFSGIGGLDLGLERAGHEVIFQCESDPYRRRVLARHWPGVPCFEDVRSVHGDGEQGGVRFRRGDAGFDSAERRRDGSLVVDLIAGGFPCQDLSVAGRRAGLDGSRSGLFFEFARVADALLPDGGWVLIENVPGLLSSNGGRDFAVLRATLAELGFLDGAYRILDSRYFGVPQRRRRVFILARCARGRRASEVLLEPESGGGDFEAGREARQGVAGSVTDGAQSARSLSDDLDGVGAYVAGPLTTRYGKGVNTTADDGAAVISQRMRGTPRTSAGLDHLDRAEPNPRPDGPRYAACGDAVTVNVSYWIGKRLMEHG